MNQKPEVLHEEYPEVGDLIVATVKRIVGYGAYVSLDEYPGKEGLIHISEISTKWVRNIRDHLREGEKQVLKVLRIDPSRGQIDLSLRRVTGREKVEKMLEWKREKKASSILKAAADQLGGGFDLEKLKEKLSSKYASIYEALEEAVEEGEKAFRGLELPKEWIDVLTALSRAKIKLEESKVTATIELTCTTSDGIDAIKESLIKAKEVKKPRRAKIRVYTIGSPKYKIEAVAGSHLEAESLLEEAVKEALNVIKEHNGEGRRIG
ncbi:MAG: translation initiation factor IF-2 subunit alpha [Candidatus Bathyarchaeia archaeon]